MASTCQCSSPTSRRQAQTNTTVYLSTSFNEDEWWQGNNLMYKQLHVLRACFTELRWILTPTRGRSVFSRIANVVLQVNTESFNGSHLSLKLTWNTSLTRSWHLTYASKSAIRRNLLCKNRHGVISTKSVHAQVYEHSQQHICTLRDKFHHMHYATSCNFMHQTKGQIIWKDDVNPPIQ